MGGLFGKQDLTTPLLQAATKGDLDRLQTMFAKGSDVNAADGHGRTALHAASEGGHFVIVQALLEKGASVGSIRSDSGDTPLHEAALRGHTQVVSLLLDAGASPDAANVEGYTSLHLAAKSGKSDLVRFLMNRGASVDARSNDGRTPVQVAEESGRAAVADVLRGG